MRRNKLKHCCFSSNDSFIHGNPWLLSSMSCKSRLHIVEKDKVEISHFLSIKTRSSVFLKLIPYFVVQKLFWNVKSPPWEFSDLLSRFQFWGMVREAATVYVSLWGFFTIQFRPISFLRGGGSEMGYFCFKSDAHHQHNDRLMLRLMMRRIFWC